MNPGQYSGPFSANPSDQDHSGSSEYARQPSSAARTLPYDAHVPRQHSLQPLSRQTHPAYLLIQQMGDAYRASDRIIQSDHQEYQYHQAQSTMAGPSTSRAYAMPHSATYYDPSYISESRDRESVNDTIATQQDGTTPGWTQSMDQGMYEEGGAGQNTSNMTGRYRTSGSSWNLRFASEGQVGPSNEYDMPVLGPRSEQAHQGYPPGNTAIRSPEGYPRQGLSDIRDEESNVRTVPAWDVSLQSGQHPSAVNPYSAISPDSVGVTTSSTLSDLSPYQTVFPSSRVVADGEEEADIGAGGARKDKRRAQNRVAQRAFRARSRVQTQEAVNRMEHLEQLVKTQSEQLTGLTIALRQLKMENEILRAGYEGALPPGVREVPIGIQVLTDGVGRPDGHSDGVVMDRDMGGEVDGVDGGGMLDGWKESIGAWRER